MDLTEFEQLNLVLLLVSMSLSISTIILLYLHFSAIEQTLRSLYKQLIILENLNEEKKRLQVSESNLRLMLEPPSSVDTTVDGSYHQAIQHTIASFPSHSEDNL